MIKQSVQLFNPRIFDKRGASRLRFYPEDQRANMLNIGGWWLDLLWGGQNFRLEEPEHSSWREFE